MESNAYLSGTIFHEMLLLKKRVSIVISQASRKFSVHSSKCIRLYKTTIIEKQKTVIRTYSDSKLYIPGLNIVIKSHHKNYLVTDDLLT
jgi:hypothetical protein